MENIAAKLVSAQSVGQTTETTLVQWLTSPGTTNRNSALAQIQTLLASSSPLDLNNALINEDNSQQDPPLALSLALQVPCWCAHPEQQLALIRMLLEHGALPLWSSNDSKPCHYIMALEQGAFEAAELILEKGAAAAGDDIGEMMVPVFRAALAVHIQTDKNIKYACKLTFPSANSTSEEGDQSAEERQEESDEEESDEEESFAGPAELLTPAMLAAAWLIESLPPETVSKLQPGGAPSVVHALLAAFAEHVDEEARRKHSASIVLSSLPQPERSAEESLQAQQRSETVSCLLQRLWMLLQLAHEAGSPAVAMDVESFPTCPGSKHLCNFSFVWSGIKSFATAWMPHWNRDVHCIYHPTFKEAVKTFLLAASTRGLSVPSNSTEEGSSCAAKGRKAAYVFDLALVERIVGFMAEDQSAWVPVIGTTGRTQGI